MESEPIRPNDVLCEASFFQVPPSWFRCREFEQGFVKQVLRPEQDFQKLSPGRFSSRGGSGHLLGDWDIRPACKEFECFRERDFFPFHYEGEAVPASVARPAPKRLAIRVDVQGRIAVIVKRAESHKKLAAVAWLKRKTLSNQANNIRLVTDSVSEFLKRG